MKCAQRRLKGGRAALDLAAGEEGAQAAKFDLGAFHKIIDGPFSSFLPEVTGVVETGRIKADVEMFGRKVPVEFEPADLRAA